MWNTPTLKILSWNVNGLRAAAKKGFLEWVMQEKPDILCIQETKLSPDQLPFDLQHVEGYYLYINSAVRKGYSGVALYTKYKPKEVKYSFGVEKFDLEGRIVLADYEDFLLCTLYFPNGQASLERLEYKMEFYEAFLAYLEGELHRGKRIIVCGDVNTAHREIDLARPKANEQTSGFLPMERRWIDKLVGYGFFDTFRVFNQEPNHYTYWDMKSRARDRNVGWRIDYFFVDQVLRDRLESAFILPGVTGSDHCPVGITIKVPEQRLRRLPEPTV
ncbi:MAG: exodeoxyribonuclease III [Chloroflexota bacterium]|nr:exodeoxyribonuclease III [Chloroflexota bacterium]